MPPFCELLEPLYTIITIGCGPRTAVTSKMVCFVIIVSGWKPLTIITKRSILNVAAVLDPPLTICGNESLRTG